MGLRWGRVSFAVSVIVTLSSSALGGESPDGVRAPERVERPETVRRGPTTTFAYAPANVSAPRPAVVYLHGRCGVSTNGCSHFRPGVDPFGWLVCPVGNDPCAGGGASWTGATADKKKVVDDALSALASAHPDRVDLRAPTVLAGFSQGAWTALELVRATPARYRGVLLIGADVEPDVASLRASGVRRLVLMAGSRDGAASAMLATARRIAATSGAPETRFVSLGAVGHTYVGENEAPLREALEWLEAPAREELSTMPQG